MRTYLAPCMLLQVVGVCELGSKLAGACMRVLEAQPGAQAKPGSSLAQTAKGACGFAHVGLRACVQRGCLWRVPACTGGVASPGGLAPVAHAHTL